MVSIKEVSFYDLLINSIKDLKGYTFIEIKEDADASALIVNYPTKEEFEVDFIFNVNGATPRVKNDNYEYLIDGEYEYIDFNNVYFFKDGKSTISGW